MQTPTKIKKSIVDALVRLHPSTGFRVAALQIAANTRAFAEADANEGAARRRLVHCDVVLVTRQPRQTRDDTLHRWAVSCVRTAQKVPPVPKDI